MDGMELVVELVRDAMEHAPDRAVTGREWLGGMAALSADPALMLAGVIGQFASLSAHLVTELAAARGEQPDQVLSSAGRTVEASMARKRRDAGGQ